MDNLVMFVDTYINRLISFFSVNPWSYQTTYNMFTVFVSHLD